MTIPAPIPPGRPMCVCGHSWAEHRIDRVRKLCDHIDTDGPCGCPDFTLAPIEGGG